ncbi:FHA domain-containing protein FHA2-like isoform X2 [Phragmites australis]|uniref:FHA domain-containing protein FHA2-like isoform X2 n=1 Tax=Phragmites australis TaxID=29695 RepID=UPI002D77C3B5|nr:FHA domain-containing protein FHA2-like isoform X2 [Phragmites australis]
MRGDEGCRRVGNRSRLRYGSGEWPLSSAPHLLAAAWCSSEESRARVLLLLTEGSSAHACFFGNYFQIWTHTETIFASTPYFAPRLVILRVNVSAPRYLVLSLRTHQLVLERAAKSTAGIPEMAAPNSAVTSVGSGGMEPGFAKLQGANFEYFIQAYSVILGRNTEHSKVDLDLSILGGADGGMVVSRHHARIFYDFEHRYFALEVLGKHGCTIQGVSYLPGSDPVKLNSQDLIEIVGKKFYFLLPTRSIYATIAARRTHAPLQPQYPSFMRPNNPGHSYGDNYDRGNGDNGTKIGTEMRGKLMKQCKKSSGELDISNSYGINADPIGALGERVNKLEIRRADKDTDNQQLLKRADKDTDNQQPLLKEEKDVVSSLVILISDLCGPGEWVPMAKLHSKLLERFGKVWSHGKVRRYLTPEGSSSTETKGRPWCGLLPLLRKYPEHFVMSIVTRGEVTSEYVGLVS